MPSLAELGLQNEAIESTAIDQLPEQTGTFAPPPEPGDYYFQLPAVAALKNTFDVFDADGKQRLAVVFDQNAPLTIIQSPRNERDGEPFQTRINNVPRARNKDRTIIASDMDYLLKGLGETAATFPAAQKTNKGYGDALLRHAGESFHATVEWSWYCNPKRAARFEDPTTGQASEVQDASTGAPQLGCSQRYYESQVQKVEGKTPLRITCGTCGAQVRAFANLTKFRK